MTVAGRILENLACVGATRSQITMIRDLTCGPRLRGDDGEGSRSRWSATFYETELRRPASVLVADHDDLRLKNSLAYCGHTGAAMTGCGVDDAGVTAPYPLRT